MADIFVPDEQEGTKAVVRSWLRAIGDRVELDDPLVELETDKVTQEVPAPCAGILLEILLDIDAEAPPGALLGRIGESSHEPDFERAVAEAAVRKVAPMALAGVGEPPSLASSDLSDPTAVSKSLDPGLCAERNDALSPAVRRAVAQHGVDVSIITGTGRGGRISRADVDQEVARRSRSTSVAPDQSIVSQTPDASGTRSVPHDRMRLAIARNMLNSVTVAPHVTAVFEADFSAIMAHRKRHKATFEAHGVNLTFTAYLIAASVKAMAVAPSINSRWYDDRLEIYDDVNVGIGTALGDRGLVVPVVDRAQSRSLLGIAARLSDLTKRARDNALHSIDMRGGTFTISNHGVSGSLLATPIIISQPQSAILGVGKLEKRVVVREADGHDTIQIRPLCYVSLTIDHRVVDGHQTNSWLAKFVETIENWPDEG